MNRTKNRPIRKIQKEILRTLMVLVTIMTVLIAVSSIAVNIRTEQINLDHNLQNVAQAVAQFQLIQEELQQESSEAHSEALRSYLDGLKQSLTNVDVISVIDRQQIRRYHTKPELIGTRYDGTMPEFRSDGEVLYVTSDVGPSGSQRRAYAAIYDEEGNYAGFVLTVMLRQNINRIIANTILLHLLCAFAVIILAIILSNHLTGKIKRLLLGYEPDTFSAMFSVRDNILESLEEGILAVDEDGEIVYLNQAASSMLRLPETDIAGKSIEEILPELHIDRVLHTEEKYLGVAVQLEQSTDILADQIPVMENGELGGVLCILRDRTEYTKMMEDLSGVRYLVESMRANNHDFVNKLHVILGLIQMGCSEKACEYIASVTSIQQTVIQNIIRNIEDPSVAALLIGKYARAAELNIHFALKTGSRLSRNDISLMSGDLVTIIGNLLDNAMDSMNESSMEEKDLAVGIYTQPHAMLIQVDDTGMGISEEVQQRIFEYGFSTKGENRGTGLYMVQNLVQKYGGSISIESETGAGTSFTVTLLGD